MLRFEVESVNYNVGLKLLLQYTFSILLKFI
jgi:hypothetical protein